MRINGSHLTNWPKRYQMIVMMIRIISTNQKTPLRYMSQWGIGENVARSADNTQDYTGKLAEKVYIDSSE
jgi:hypothetical protein